MRRLRALRIQKLIGIVLLAATVLMFKLGGDVTATMFTLPLGLGMLFTKSVVIDI